VFVPIKVIQWVAPSLIPLNTFTEPLYEASMDLFLLHVIFPFSLQFLRPKRHVTRFIKFWLTMVGSWLDLTEYFFGRENENRQNIVANGNVRVDAAPVPPNLERNEVNPGANANHDANGGDAERVLPRPNQNIVRDAAEIQVANNLANNAIDQVNATSEIYKPPNFGIRILITLVLSWLLSVLIIVSFLSFPILLGRMILSQFIDCADIYAFITGFYALWGLVRAGAYIGTVLLVARHDVHSVISQSWQWAIVFCKLLFVGSLWFGLLPMLIGMWFGSVVFMPMKVDLFQTSVFCPYYTYAMGLLYLKVWYRIVMVEGVSDKWKAKFDKVFNDGLKNIDVYHIICNMIVPISNMLLLRLCVPYFFVKIVLPFLDLPEKLVQFWSHFVFFYFSALLGIVFGVQMLAEYLIQLHHRLRDEKYLVGKRLQNLHEEYTHNNVNDANDAIKDDDINDQDDDNVNTSDNDDTDDDDIMAQKQH